MAAPKPTNGNTPSDWQRESALIDQLKAGDQTAFRSAYRLYHQAMVGMASQYVDRSLAEDVAHDAWMAALKAIDKFEGRSTLKTWLCRITANMAFKTYRKRQREISATPFLTSVSDETTGDSAKQRSLSEPELALHTFRVQKRVSVVMKRMNRTQANALYLKGASSMDGQQISDMLAVSHTNLRVILHRARTELAARL